MKMLLALLLVVPVLAGCGSDGGSNATDPSGSEPTSAPTSAPTATPAAPGTVDTRGLVTVMDTGTPELCLGPVAESDPPQCSGPEVDGWDWAAHQGMYESHQGIRWGQFLVSGTWDGSTFTYASAVAAPVYDPAVTPKPTYPKPAVEHSQDELASIAHDVQRLPGYQDGQTAGHQVRVDVVYDDGSLQDWADQTYGKDVVVVSSLLVDRES